MKGIDASHNHPAIRNLNFWRGRGYGGVFYERQSFWSAGLNWSLFSWALPLYVELTRVWGSGPKGEDFSFCRLGLTVRLLCLSFHVTLWNKRGF